MNSIFAFPQHTKMFDVAIMHMTCQVVIKKLLQGVDKIQENDSKGGYIQCDEKKNRQISIKVAQK